jgi:hypothetical protein
MTRLRRFFAGHPVRIGAAAVALVAAAALTWYLGSPLFIRTYADEALPGATPTLQPGAVQATAGATGTPLPSLVRSRVLAMGELNYVDTLHHGKGPVLIIETSPGAMRFVRFEEVEISNAPDVHVYLARQTGGAWSEGESLYLGPLKATNGSFNYEIPAGTDLVPYRSVVVWCRAFSVLITWADLS